jgi:hypothetical protein
MTPFIPILQVMQPLGQPMLLLQELLPEVDHLQLHLLQHPVHVVS